MPDALSDELLLLRSILACSLNDVTLEMNLVNGIMKRVCVRSPTITCCKPIRVQCVRHVTINKSTEGTTSSEKTPIDNEKEMFRIKRTIGAHFSKGDYESALAACIELEDYVKTTLGSGNAVHASCLNNVALMNKMLGHQDVAMQKYTESLHMYEDHVGKKHPSYASTLANLGLLYKSMAENAQGMDKLNLIERAEESFVDAKSIRKELAGDRVTKETVLSSINLASIWSLSGKLEAAQNEYRCAVEQCRQNFGNHLSGYFNAILSDALTATALNNLGFHCKVHLQYDEAKLCYEEALAIRSATLGEVHPDTIVTMNNLAELLYAKGEAETAKKMQEDILKILEKLNPQAQASKGQGNSDNNVSITDAVEVNRHEQTQIKKDPAENSSMRDHRVSAKKSGEKITSPSYQHTRPAQRRKK